MDPLVDAYNKGDELILEEQTKKSIKMTREFIVELFIYSLGMQVENPKSMSHGSPASSRKTFASRRSRCAVRRVRSVWTCRQTP